MRGEWGGGRLKAIGNHDDDDAIFILLSCGKSFNYWLVSFCEKNKNRTEPEARNIFEKF